MYLYQLAFKEYVNGVKSIREVILLQHKKDFDQTEFELIVDHYYKQGKTEYELLAILEQEEGFRIVPKVTY